MTFRSLHAVPLLSLLSVLQPAGAAEIVVNVAGADSADGEIGCALYGGEEGFPMDASAATQSWHPVLDGSAECRFTGIEAGRYAVAVSHDLNGNRVTDTNLFGMPREAWGVSGNVRPKLRAPKFSEAAFDVAGDTVTRIDIRIER